VTPPELVERRHAAEAVARDAGLLAMRYLANPTALDVRRKGAQDVLTAADGAVERLIVTTLRGAFPRDAFLGEEGGRVHGSDADSACWVIDPIDGTANFARGLPHWCVSIALVVAGRTELGVIYDAGADLLYAATRGMGAWRNGERLAVSATIDITRASVDVGYSSRTPAEPYGSLVTGLLRRGISVTQCGSAALGLARVADGRLDGYAERHLYAWDALAGLLLVAEAGGCANAFLIGDAMTAGNETIAATPALYSVLVDALTGR
jgi:myo-inositol-1(or 4)-monophosphatase